MKLTIDTASVDMLRAYADQQGLEYKPQHGAPGLRALIRAAGIHEEVVELLGAQPVQPVPTKPATVDPKSDTVRVLIYRQEGDEASVYLGNNGRGMLVPKGKEVEIPRHIYHALDIAKQIRYNSSEDGIDDGYEVHAYPHTVLG